MFSFVGKSKRGALRKGDTRMFPVLTADEVVDFDPSKKNRVKNGGTVDDSDNLIFTVNSEVIDHPGGYGRGVSCGACVSPCA